jgi:hypothetical protein
MPGFDKAYFLESFSQLDSSELIERALRNELAEEAKEAIRELLQQRGIQGERLELRVNDVRKDMFRRSGVTNQCDFCGQSAALSAVRDGAQKFCDETCRRNARLFELSIDIAPELIQEHAVALSLKPCPQCGKQTVPIEMWPRHRIVSLLYVCLRDIEHTLCCPRCGRKRAALAAAYSLVLGWWSLPGLFITPVYVFRNLRIAWRGRGKETPSPHLLRHARLDLASSLQSAGLLGAAGRATMTGASATAP